MSNVVSIRPGGSQAGSNAPPPVPHLINRMAHLAPRRPETISTAELASRLGIGEQAPRTIIGKLRALHREQGLPPPITPRVQCGHVLSGADAIHWRARWDRGEALAWLDSWRGDPDPAGTAAQQSAARHQFAANLDALLGQKQERAA